METVGPEIANEVLSWLRGAGDLVAQEAPLLARDIVRWHLVGNAVVAACLGAVALACWWAAVFFSRIKSMDNDYRAGAVAGFATLAAMLSIAAMIPAAQSIKAAVAPRVVIVEQMAKLVR